MEEKKQPNIKILVACHKKDPNIRCDDIYSPIHVGKALHSDVDLGFPGDDTGDNISEKNGSYCELTALYWAWRNLKDVDYIGLAHYRRYFDSCISFTSIPRILEKHDAIFAKLHHFPFPAVFDLREYIPEEDIVIMIDSILEFHPEYSESISNYFYASNKLTQFNMMIMKWNDFNAYCEFLFPILSHIYDRSKRHSYSRLNRNIGYMAEDMLGLYALYNNLKIKYARVECAHGRDMTDSRLYFVKKIRDKLAFKLARYPKCFSIPSSVRVGLENDGIILKNV